MQSAAATIGEFEGPVAGSRGGGFGTGDAVFTLLRVHRFNASGPEGLFDQWTEGPKPRLSAEQLAELAGLVEAGPDREVDGVVRWRGDVALCSDGSVAREERAITHLRVDFVTT